MVGGSIDDSRDKCSHWLLDTSVRKPTLRLVQIFVHTCGTCWKDPVKSCEMILNKTTMEYVRERALLDSVVWDTLRPYLR
jgi:hypothetical protein